MTTEATPTPQAAPESDASKPLKASMAERISALGKDPAFPKLVPEAPGVEAPAPGEKKEEKKPDAEAKKPDPEPQHKMLQRLAQMDREKRALEEELKSLKPKAGYEDELRKLAKESPLQAAERLGLSLEQLMDLKLNGGQPTAEAKAAAEKDELKREIEALKKARASDEQERARIAGEHARSTWRESVKQAATAEAFPHLHVLGDDAVDTVEDVFTGKVQALMKEVGRPLTREEVQPIREAALAETEKYYMAFRERLLTVGQSAATIPGKAEAPAPRSAAAIPSQQQGQRRPTTLTNSVSTSAPPATTRHLSMKERERALARGLSQLPPSE